MGVLIAGMEMPTEGGTICVYKISGKFFAARAGKDELFPIIPINEPHGRLIDGDALIAYCKDFAEMYKDSSLRTDKARRDELLSVIGEIINMPIVIPASGEED